MPTTQADIAPLEGAGLWGFLERARTMRIATQQGDDPIEMSSVWFVVRNETLYFAIDPTVGEPGRSTTPSARHLPLLERGGRVTALVDEGEELTTFRGAEIVGSVRKIERAPLKEELLDLALEKYFYVGHPHLEHYLSRGMLEVRQWFQIVPDRIVGWDRRLLPQAPIMERRIIPPFLRKKRK